MLNMKTYGLADKAALFFQNKQLKDRALWKKFVDVYRTRPDSENWGWRGEYWGKMLRGAALVYSYTKDEALYDVLTETVSDMLTVAKEDGRVSTYAKGQDFDAWDLWCRKYVILACEYYLDICKDEAFKNRILAFIAGCADDIMLHIGDKEGQKDINDATRNWFGLNSSSILEPIVRLYRLTGQEKYLDFATYIVRSGGAKGINVFRLAYENKLYPYQYGVSKAYEMMSCFEGLLEYYYATGIEDCKTAVIRFANAVMESELSVIGCSGITHELFDHTSTRQTVRQDTVLQETCVTVTWMKLCSRLLELTRDPRFADCMEQSFYNAYLGTLNTEGKISPYMYETHVKQYGREYIIDTFLPVDSYSPLLSGKRGVCVGGGQLLSDLSYYGCCACIASAGVGVFMNHMVTADDSGVTVNFFETGTARLQYEDVTVEITQKTEYPTDGKILLTVKTSSPKEFELRVRVPGWTGSDEGYAVYKKEWSEDTLELCYPMPLRSRRPQTWQEDTIYIPEAETVYHKPEEDNYIALMRGPITLAADSRTGRPAGSVFDFDPVGELCQDRTITKDVPCLLKMRFWDKNGETFYLVDYASAGKDWETEIAAWLKTE